MRRIILCVFGIACSISESTAHDFVDAYFVAAGSGEQTAKIVFGESGVTAPVLGSFEKEPAQCPDGSFWVHNDVAVQSCTGDLIYQFKRGSAPAGFPYQGAIPLHKVGAGPGTGTDIPPPMMPSPQQ